MFKVALPPTPEFQRALAQDRPCLKELKVLLQLKSDSELEKLTRKAFSITRRRFGNTVQLFSPLYLSNHCVNTCLYCGFSRTNDIARKTLTVGEVEDELKLLTARGFRHLLLVSAEHPKFVSPEYLVECVQLAKRYASSVQVEVQAQPEDIYCQLKAAGCDGVVIYQETYDRATYAQLHTHGLKRDFDNRLAAPDRIAKAGIKNIGLGVLLGLREDWRQDVLALIDHARQLQKRHWRAQLTVALPRLKPAAGGFKGPVTVSDRDFIAALTVLRIALHEAGIVVSTREEAGLRDSLVGLATQMSAGSSTEPGGYSRAGESQEQFSISDRRSANEVAIVVASRGYEPVWKDWHEGI